MELLERIAQILLLAIVLIVVLAIAFSATPQTQTIKAGYADSSGFATDNPLAHEEAHARYTAPAIIEQRRSSR